MIYCLYQAAEAWQHAEQDMAGQHAEQGMAWQGFAAYRVACRASGSAACKARQSSRHGKAAGRAGQQRQGRAAVSVALGLIAPGQVFARDYFCFFLQGSSRADAFMGASAREHLCSSPHVSLQIPTVYQAVSKFGK